MTVEALRNDDRSTSATVRVGAWSSQFGFQTTGAPVADHADHLVAASLLPAMRAGGGLTVHGAVGGRLLAGQRKVQTLVHGWDPAYRRVGVATEGRGVGSRASSGACLFSGGIDSFHAALRHRDAIEALVFIDGFDGVRGHGPTFRPVDAVRGAADELGLDLVVVDTDVRRFTDRFVPWRMAHGSVMAAVAMVLAPRFGRMCVPGSLSYANVHPYGSHPLLDPLWSTEETELVYDGFDVSRFEKVAAVAASPAALRWTRVCSRGGDDGWNCGRCEKCLRTMVALRACGALDRAEAFPTGLDLAAVRSLAVYRTESRWFWEQSLAAIEADGRDPELASAIRQAIAPTFRRRALEVRWRRRARRRRRALER